MRTLKLADNLCDCNARLIVRQSPDATERLEKADKEDTGQGPVHHLEVKRRAPFRIPINDGGGQERKGGAKASGKHNGIESFRLSIVEMNVLTPESINSNPRQDAPMS